MNNLVRSSLVLALVLGVSSTVWAEAPITTLVNPDDQSSSQGTVLFVGALVDRSCILDMSRSDVDLQAAARRGESIPLTLGLDCSQGTDSIDLSFESNWLSDDGKGGVHIEPNASLALSARGYNNNSNLNGKSLVFDLSDKGKGTLSMTAKVGDEASLSAAGAGDISMMTITMLQK